MNLQSELLNLSAIKISDSLECVHSLDTAFPERASVWILGKRLEYTVG